MRALPLIAPLLLASCGLTPHAVRLPASSALAPAGELVGVLETSAARSAPPIRLALPPFEDLRRHPAILGERRNAWDMSTAEVRAVAPVANWMRDAVAAALSADGFELVAPVNAGTPPLALHGEVERALVLKRGDTDAVVELSVRLKRGFRTLFSRTYRGLAHLSELERTRHREQTGEALDPFGECLVQALERALAPLPGDLRSALEREAADRD